MFSHLVLTDDDLKRYIAEAKRHDAGSMSARIFAAWKSSDEEGKDRILDEFIEASVSIGNCEPKRVRGFKKLQRNLSRLSNRRGNREVVLPVTMDRDFLKRLRVHAAIENRSLDNFILVALYNAMEVIDDASALTRRVLSKLDAHRIKSLRDCAKLVHTKITCCFPHKN
jgi:hypothetical protein